MPGKKIYVRYNNDFSCVKQTYVTQKYTKIFYHSPICTEVVERILNRQTDKFTTCGLRKLLERDPHEAEIFPRKKKDIKIGAFLKKKSVNKH